MYRGHCTPVLYSVASAGSYRQHNTRERRGRGGSYRQNAALWGGEPLRGATHLPFWGEEKINYLHIQKFKWSQEDFDIDEEDDSPEDDEEELASDDEDDSDRESVVGEETDPDDALEDIIDQYNSDHSEIMDSWQRTVSVLYNNAFTLSLY